MSQAASGMRAGMKCVPVLAAALAVAGCAGGGMPSFGGMFGSSDAPAQATQAQASAAPAMATTNPDGSAADLACPYVDVREGAAAHRVYAGGQGNANVRYQFSMGDIVRSCRLAGNQLILKVGVEGKVLLGPAGAPSSFTVPITVAVRREQGLQFINTRTYRIAAAIPAGASQTTFAMVSDEIAVPFISPKSNEDYQVFVGFEGAGTTTTAERRRR